MTFGSVLQMQELIKSRLALQKISQSGTWQSAYANTGSGQPIATDFTMDNQTTY